MTGEPAARGPVPVSAAEAATPLQRAAVVIRDLQARLAAAEAAGAEPIAVVGIGCRFPGADGPEAFRRLLRDGVDATGPVPAERWPAETWTGDGPGRIASPRGGFLAGSPADFDAAFFRIAPREAASIDPQQRLLLEVAWEALEDAGRAGPDLAGSRTGVYVGISLFDWGWRLMGRRRPDTIDAYAASGVMHSVASGRIAFAFDLAGPALSVDTACSSSLVAVHLAVKALRAGECDMALAGGASLMLEPELGVAFSQSRMLAPDGRCKTFSAAADGYGRAEGAGIVVLKRLSTALRDGDRIVAVVRGSAVNQDGATSGLTVPNGPAQQAVIRAALADARLAPADVAYVEAHGTGTPLGDPIEIGALAAVFAAGRSRAEPLLVGSVKTNIGHAEGAAGIAGFIKAALSVESGVLPRHLHAGVVNPLIDWADGRIAVVDETRPLAPRNGRRVVGVSAFGFSGTNAHVVLEAPPSRDVPILREHARPGLLVLSAATPEALAELARRTAARLADADPAEWPAICRTAGAGRGRFAERLALVAESPSEAAALLARGIDRAAGADTRRAAAPGGLAFVYTGQGAFAGAAPLSGLDDLGRAFADASRRAADWIAAHLGEDLHALLRDPGRLAARTDLAQPVQFAIQVALTAGFAEARLVPDRVLGHSLGEFAAAHASGVFDLETGLRLTAARGRLMHGLAGTPGGVRTGMLAVALDAASLSRHLGGDDGLVLAADNAPRATVVAGPVAALARLAARLGPEIAAEALDVPLGFHSPALAPMVEEFRAALAAERLAPAGPGFVSAAAGGPVGTAAADPDFWLDQILRPVRFRGAVATLAAAGVTDIVEIGPRPRLAGAVAATMAAARPEAAVRVSATVRTGTTPRRAFLETIADLHRAGRDFDADALEPGAGTARLPAYPWQRRRFWTEADPAAAARPEADPLRPTRLATPLAQTVQTVRLAAANPAWLADHRVGGLVVVPLAVVAEILRRVAADRSGDVVAGLQLARPIEVPDGGVEIHLVTEPARDGRRAVSIHARPAEAEEATFTLHGRATLGPADPGAAPGPAPAPDGATVPMAPADLWNRAARDGIDLGPAFRRLLDLTVAPGSAVATLAPTGPGEQSLTLDAALQTALALLPDTGPWVPVGIAGWTPAPAGPGPLTVTTEMLVEGARPTFRLRFRAADGSAAGGVAELVYGRLPAAGDRLRHEIRWNEAPRPTAPRSLADLAPGLGAAMAEIFAAPAVRAYEAALPALEDAIPERVAAALVALGWNDLPPGAYGIDELADRLGVAPGRRRLFARLLALLPPAGRANGDPVEGRRVAPLAPRPLPLPDDPAVAAERGFAERCTAALPGVLRGAVDPLDLLFPGRSLDEATRLYARSPWSTALGDTLAAAVARLSADAAGRRVLRVLEVGAGTGATTARLLPLLPEPCDYVFTDVSPLFLRAAAERFGGRPGFVTRLLDLEDAAAAPDLADFDLIVAANVVHATADLAATLGVLARRLAPGGTLVLQEGTGALAWGDVTFGLTDGWWRFRDVDLRPDHPMPSPARWRDALARAGLPETLLLEADGVEGGRGFRQAVILARRRPGPILIVGDGPVTRAFAAHLSATGRSVARVGDAATAVSRLPDVEAVILAAEADGGDASAGGFDPAEAAVATAIGLTRQLAALAASAGPGRAVPPIRILTVGATEIELDGGPAGAAATAASGLVRALAAERPELFVGQIDLAAPAPGLALPAADLARAADELAARDGERAVAIRGGRRFVARLEPARPAPALGADLRLEAAERGVPASLVAVPAEPVAPGPGEIEIEVAAAGLNFRDVLLALDLYPEPGRLGREAAGIVRRVGPGVTGFRPGDAVFGLGAGTLATRAVLRAEHALPLPPGLSADVAAAQLVAWVTALKALDDVAAVRPGDRVLVHAAASGTGLAVLRLARARGAEVHATASPAKQALLSAEGAASIHSSRDPGFAAGILAATGGRGVDVVVDALTGPGMIEASLAAAAPGARFVELGRLGVPTAAEMAARRPDLAYAPVELARDARESPALVADLVRRAGRILAEGVVRSLPVSSVPFERAGEALRLMQEGRQTGRIAVTRRLAPRGRAGAGTWLVTGAFGGVGTALARHLADTGRAAALLLVGRRPPGPDAAAALDRIGAPVTVEVADVADRAAMARIVARCGRDLPPLAGVVHAAGRLDDAPVAAMTPERVAAVMTPKVAGAWILHELTRDLPLDHFVLFGSAVGTLGNAGQTNHAAASAALDGLARHRRALGLPALAIDWGVWGETGAALRDERAEDLARRGFRPMATAAALAAFDRALGEDRGRILVADLDAERLAGRRGDDRLLDALRPDGATSRRAAEPVLERREGERREADRRAVDWRLLPAGARRHAVAAAVDRAVAAVLGHAADRIDPEGRFFEIGMDSLTAVELRHRLVRDLGVDLPATLVFDCPTPAAVVALVLAGTEDDGPAGSPRPGAGAPGGGEASADTLDDEDLSAFADRRLDDIEEFLA